MQDTQKVAMAALCVTAAVLAAMIALTVGDRAEAGESCAGGHYIMFTAQAPGATDMLFVIDRGARKMNAYGLGAPDNTITALEQIDLDRAFRD